MQKAFGNVHDIEISYELFFQEDFRHYMDYLEGKAAGDITTFNLYLSGSIQKPTESIAITILAKEISPDEIKKDYQGGNVKVV